MVFNSLHFVWFFLAVYALYRVLPHRPQNWLLLVASLILTLFSAALLTKLPGMIASGERAIGAAWLVL